MPSDDGMGHSANLSDPAWWRMHEPQRGEGEHILFLIQWKEVGRTP
jgi:hypothetical protein